MGFLEQLAATLWSRYEQGVSSLAILLPTRRARLFLNDALSRLSARPLWQPEYTSIDAIMERIAGLSAAGSEKLITELYKVYSRYHDESFDSFYFWGETLLADFDQIDKYLIDADKLFANIHDIKEIEAGFDYLAPEQRAVVESFWKAFDGNSRSGEKEHFLSVWKTLAPIYHAFRASLRGQGIAYTGMVHRLAAEKLAAWDGEGGKYIIAGFNALTECEKRLFDHLQKLGLAEFYWDTDDYYISRPEQEAGLFLRRNIERYPQIVPFFTDNFRQTKELAVVSAPSDSMQAKYAADFIAGATADRTTAVVLTDENLLTPVLYSVSTVAEDINITMGYPLRQTLAYSFAERALQLQSGAKHRDGRTSFRHTDAVGLLTHPFLRDHAPHQTAEVVRRINDGRLIYVDSNILAITPLLADIFSAPEGWEQVAEYLVRILTAVARLPYEGDDRAQRTEYFASMVEAVTKTANSLKGCGIELSARIFVSLLRSHLQTIRIPYEGEPLQGVQVMGILETRNLDFDNVLILSANDDTFPGNRMASPSFIPYNLRTAYGLPDAAHHEGVYAYYFYRLVQRARKVHIVYCSTSDERRTGEESRYIYQLRYESGHRVDERRIDLEINHSQDNAIVVAKSGEVLRTLEAMLAGSHRLSPTALYAYIECPLKFYFRSVAGLRPAEELTDQVEAPMLGSILHKAMELLYRDLVHNPHPQERIAAMIGTPAVDEAVDSAIRSEYLSQFQLPREEYGGNLLLAAGIVKKYIDGAILPFDARGEAMIDGLETPLEARFNFDIPGGTEEAGAEGGAAREVTLAGKADRTERLPDGVLRIVDYKTGGASPELGSVEALFSPRRRERNAAAFQTLLYALMASRMGNADVQPAIYYLRDLSSEGYSPLLYDKSAKTHIARYDAVRTRFEQFLAERLAELFDTQRPFAQCADSETCSFCDFSKICMR